MWHTLPSRVVLLDNGAYQLKSSLQTDSSPNIHLNAVIRDKHSRSVHISNRALEDGLNNSRQSKIVHPQVRGLLQDSDIQSVIWRECFGKAIKKDGSLSDQKLIEYAQESCLLMTAQPMLPDFI